MEPGEWSDQIAWIIKMSALLFSMRYVKQPAYRYYVTDPYSSLDLIREKIKSVWILKIYEFA